METASVPFVQQANSDLPCSLWCIPLFQHFQKGNPENLYVSHSSNVGPSPVIDIDYKHRRDPNWFTEYVVEFYNNLLVQEKKYCPAVDYLSYNDIINEEHRSNLINMMLFISQGMRFTANTLQLAVNITDRYLGKVLEITRDDVAKLNHESTRKKRKRTFSYNYHAAECMSALLQCDVASVLLNIGCAALRIAYKMDVNYPINMDRFLSLSEKDETIEQPPNKKSLLDYEMNILAALNYDISAPTMHSFLSRYNLAAQLKDTSAIQLARCVCERSLLSYQMLRYPPSMIAASAVYMARAIMKGKKPNFLCSVGCYVDRKTAVDDHWQRGTPENGEDFCWTATLEQYTGYAVKDLQPCILEFQHLLAMETYKRARIYSHNLLYSVQTTPENNGDNSVCSSPANTSCSINSLNLSKQPICVFNFSYRELMNVVLQHRQLYSASAPQNEIDTDDDDTNKTYRIIRDRGCHSLNTGAVAASVLQYHSYIPAIFNSLETQILDCAAMLLTKQYPLSMSSPLSLSTPNIHNNSIAPGVNSYAPIRLESKFSCTTNNDIVQQKQVVSTVTAKSKYCVNCRILWLNDTDSNTLSCKHRHCIRNNEDLNNSDDSIKIVTMNNNNQKASCSMSNHVRDDCFSFKPTSIPENIVNYESGSGSAANNGKKKRRYEPEYSSQERIATIIIENKIGNGMSSICTNLLSAIQSASDESIYTSRTDTEYISALNDTKNYKKRLYCSSFQGNDETAVVLPSVISSSSSSSCSNSEVSDRSTPIQKWDSNTLQNNNLRPLYHRSDDTNSSIVFRIPSSVLENFEITLPVRQCYQNAVTECSVDGSIHFSLSKDESVDMRKIIADASIADVSGITAFYDTLKHRYKHVYPFLVSIPPALF